MTDLRLAKIIRRAMLPALGGGRRMPCPAGMTTLRPMSLNCTVAISPAQRLSAKGGIRERSNMLCTTCVALESSRRKRFDPRRRRPQPIVRAGESIPARAERCRKPRRCACRGLFTRRRRHLDLGIEALADPSPQQSAWSPTPMTTTSGRRSNICNSFRLWDRCRVSEESGAAAHWLGLMPHAHERAKVLQGMPIRWRSPSPSARAELIILASR